VSRSGDLDWNDLRYFLSAARAGTLAGAARSLEVDHSTIGRRLTALEEVLGVPLLTRGPDGLALTDIGQKLVPLLEDMERAALAARELATSQKTRVRLATPSGFSRYIHRHLPGFQAANPGITIELLSSSRPVDLKKSEADLALRTGPVGDQELVARKIADAGWSLYASPAYLCRHAAPADPRQLSGHDLLGFEAGLAEVPGARWIEEHGQGANVIMRCRELVDMVAACVAGLGLAVLPCMATEEEPALVRLTSEVLGTRRLSLVYRKEVLRSPPVVAVIEFVTEVMRAHADQMSGAIGEKTTTETNAKR
jgi:DNA-binding transcriptional LysR family regulator